NRVGGAGRGRARVRQERRAAVAQAAARRSHHVARWLAVRRGTHVDATAGAEGGAMMRRRELLAGGAAAAALLACRRRGGRTGLGFSQMDNAGSCRIAETNSMKNAVRKRGDRYELVVTDAQDQTAKQVSDVEDL